MGIVVVYDCTDEISFGNVRRWISQIHEHSSPNVATVLVGNKSDCPGKRVTTEEGQDLADFYGMKFFETSARSGVNVRELFESVAKEMTEKRIEDNGNTTKGISLKSVDHTEFKKKAKCC